VVLDENYALVWTNPSYYEEWKKKYPLL
jgi:hypothetical protein